MGVMNGGGETPLSAVRPCEMGVTPKKALDMYGSPHLTILYLLRGEQGDLEDKSRVWIGDTRDCGLTLHGCGPYGVGAS